MESGKRTRKSIRQGGYVGRGKGGEVQTSGSNGHFFPLHGKPRFNQKKVERRLEDDSILGGVGKGGQSFFSLGQKTQRKWGGGGGSLRKRRASKKDSYYAFDSAGKGASVEKQTEQTSRSLGSFFPMQVKGPIRNLSGKSWKRRERERSLSRAAGRGLSYSFAAYRSGWAAGSARVGKKKMREKLHY